jgi:MFS transporter, PAT family, beta-lactamase induction signal transducer AmpG
MLVVFLLGFSGGLPLLLTSQMLQAWMTGAGASLDQLAALSTVGLAYTFKFLWAPLLDRYALPFLGRRRGWLLATQLALAIAIVAMGQLDPRSDALFAMAIVVAVLGASQDIVIDAYKVDILPPEERTAGASAYLIGYRVALVVAGTVALVMADHLPWSVIYALLAATLVVGVVATVMATEPPAPAERPASLDQAILMPVRELWERLRWRVVTVVGFTMFYRFGDYFAQSLIIPFFNRAAGFRFTEIAAVYKVVGFGGIALGGIAAGFLVPRYGMRRMLVVFGAAQAITNLLYVWLASSPGDLGVFCIAVFVDNTAGAMGTAAFIAVLMSKCSPAFSATQFAILTSLSSVGQRVFGPLADDVVSWVGWPGFFVITSLVAVPGIVLAYYSEPIENPRPPEPS